jgi:hypothetical protein
MNPAMLSAALKGGPLPPGGPPGPGGPAPGGPPPGPPVPPGAGPGGPPPGDGMMPPPGASPMPMPIPAEQARMILRQFGITESAVPMLLMAFAGLLAGSDGGAPPPGPGGPPPGPPGPPGA